MIPGFHPLGKTALGRAIRNLTMDVVETEDSALLTVLLESEKGIIDQCRSQLPDFYEGLEETINRKQNQLKETTNG